MRVVLVLGLLVLVGLAQAGMSPENREQVIRFPTALSEHPGALNIGIEDVGHHALLLSERVYRLAKENLDVDPKQC